MEAKFTNSLPIAGKAQNILSTRIKELEVCCLTVEFELGRPGEFSVEIKNGIAKLSAASVSDFISAAGRLLIHLSKNIENVTYDTFIQVKPAYNIRTHYMPAHFGNSFEAAWPLEMERYLEDAALSGANGYGDWFDPNDMPDPYNPRVYCSKSMNIWEKKKKYFRTAMGLGMETMVVITHNVAFTDQLRPEWEAVHSHKLRVQGQVLCPSIPAARAVCLKNHENLFKDLLASDVHIDRLSFCPYDDGGCACDKCQPYYPTFLSMTKEILEIAQKYFPDIKMDIIGWWTSEVEMTQIKSFVKSLKPGIFGHFQFNPPYSQAHEIPAGLRNFIGDLPLSTFVHIGYSDDRADVYNKYGIHIAPYRLKSLISTFKDIDCEGANTYNEGFNEHLNVFLSSRLLMEPKADTIELLTDYCAWIFGLSGKTLSILVAILDEMQYLSFDKAESWQSKLEMLNPYIKTPPRQEWVFDHIYYKAILMSLDYKIGNGSNWKSSKDIEPFQPLIDERIEKSEELWRDVYKLGAVAHIFIPSPMYPNWYKKYDEIMGISKGLIIPGSVIDRNA